MQGRHFPCSHARSGEKQRERLNPGEWKKPHPAQSLEGLGAAWLPAAPGLKAALDFELLVGFFCLFVLEAHLIISACYPIHGSLPISLPLACSCSRTSVGWCKPHRASMWTNPPCLAQAACAPFAVPTAPSQVTCSHHGTHGLTQADLWSARLLPAPSFPSFCESGHGWCHWSPQLELQQSQRCIF